MPSDRKALVIGIDHYDHVKSLHGCVNDATSVYALIKENADSAKSLNFVDPVLLTSSSDSKPVTEESLRDHIRRHFLEHPPVTAFFYFAGHGFLDANGARLLASNSKPNHGITLDEVVGFANKCKARNSIIILDCCHSGNAGSSTLDANFSVINTGTTILTASTADQYAKESGGRGVFTNLLVDALEGSAANLLGQITPGSIYAHIDQSLGPNQQRPVFKTNVEEFVSLRQVKPPIERTELRQIKDFFPKEDFIFQLDPTYEPERAGNEPPGFPSPIFENNVTFSLLQKYNRLNLLVPVDAPHLWHAAMNSKACKLTKLGEHYRHLAAAELI